MRHGGMSGVVRLSGAASASAAGGGQDRPRLAGKNCSRLRDDRGAMNIVVLPVVVALVFAAVFLIRNLGGGVDDSRQARVAADAAALAAAGAWSESLESGYYSALGSQATYRAFAGKQMKSFATSRARDRADYFAEENGTTVVSFKVSNDGTVTVRVRDDERLPDTGQQAEHQSTARVKLESGVCRSGSRVGYRISGACVISIPPPDPEAPVAGAPRVLDAYSARVVLVG